MKPTPFVKEIPAGAISSIIKLPSALPEAGNQTRQQFKISKEPKAHLYFFVFASWLFCLIWFEPRLTQLLLMAENATGYIALLLFIVFINIAWLYGLYNISIVLFAVLHRYTGKRRQVPAVLTLEPSVALLYTTCNDFSPASVISCLQQDYSNYKVYLLDDSKDENYIQMIDDFAAQYPQLVRVIRRKDRRAYKAGNLNHALALLKEKYFAIADADEILPPDFLAKTAAVLEADETCGFVQANHRSNPNAKSKLAKALGVGIDIHWKWYQPLRNEFGFVMFLGHGALLRKSCWEQIGGFPEIVSEDLGYAIRIRELGYRGYFLEDVICYEDFPETVRAFRVRHMKWTRGTSEFLAKELKWLLRAKKITWQEKMDILFPTLNLPLTLLFFLFMVNANLVLPYLFGQSQSMTFTQNGHEASVNILRLQDGFNVIYSVDFYLITILTFLSPIFCFILALAHKPAQLFRFLAHSTALYAALSPLSSIGVIGYMLTGKATFLVTGDTVKRQTIQKNGLMPFSGLLRNFFAKSHPDDQGVRYFEIATGIIFGTISLLMFQVSFMGLCFAFILLPLMHRLGWENKLVRILVYIPFALILAGLILSTMSVAGMQSTFFGYGFHF